MPGGSDIYFFETLNLELSPCQLSSLSKIPVFAGGM
jgi:hypothetical protein